MRIVLIAILLVALSLFAAIATANAHDPDTGEPNWITDGQYSDPNTGAHCCGPRDCEVLDKKTIEATPKGFILHSFKDELVPYVEATPSEDGKFWLCKRYENAEAKRRCFFAPVGTE